VKAGVSAFSEQFGRAKTQLVAFLAAFEFAGRLREVIELADAWNQMGARLKLATAGTNEYKVAQAALFEIAQRMGVPLQETTALYGKLQQSVRMLGGEQKDALTITESISQALRISGARPLKRKRLSCSSARRWPRACCAARSSTPSSKTRPVWRKHWPTV
jgi:hypothetical protein